MNADANSVMGPLTMSRRNALRLAAVAVPSLAGLSLSSATASAAPARPTGTAYVTYESLYKSGDSLQAVINKVTGNRILTLPPGTFTFRDFRNGNGGTSGIGFGTGSASGCRGIAGSGRSTILQVVANTATRNLGNGFAGDQIKASNKSNVVLSNFTLKGGAQNGLIYSGISVSGCADARVSWLYLSGGSRGNSQTPPGETFGINVNGSPRCIISDCEVDGRDPATGVRVASSPIGWNNTTDAKVYRVYAHHGKAGMLTFWNTQNIYTEDYHCFSTSSGPGSLNGSGINHEQSNGVIKHVRPILMINGAYCGTADATGSTGMHVSIFNTFGDVTNLQILEPTFDRGPGSTGMFAAGMYDGYTQNGVKNKAKTPPKVVKNGVTLIPSNHPTAGWGDKDPKKYFSVIH